MLARSLIGGTVSLWVVLTCCWLSNQGWSQDPAAPAPPPPVPQGVEVLSRGPVHEAFASLTAEPTPAKAIAKQPPNPITEMPPEDKPEGNVIWIGGYWAYDDDRADYLWVSGIWRSVPPGKKWVSGYWKDTGNSAWQWIPGFWTAAVAPADNPTEQITYLPAPPAPPDVASPGQPPNPDSFYVPGTWAWNGTTYAWRAGYWARVQPGYVWVPAHFRWTPSGHIYVAGYWDYAVSKRGVLYAPVFISPDVVTVNYVYTPAYCVSDTLVIDSLFVRPSYCHYYFGDYYAPGYRTLGFESCVVYSNNHYDSIIVYERYERRSDPTWFTVQVSLYNDRAAGRAPCPPRTLVQQNTIIQNNVTNVTNNVTNVTNVTKNVTNNTNVTNNVTNNNKTVNNTGLVTSSQLASARGTRTVPMDQASRTAARQQAVAVQQVAQQRTRTEAAMPAGNPTQPRQASLHVPNTTPVGASPSSVHSTPTASQAGNTGHPTTPTTGTSQGANHAVPPAPGTSPGTRTTANPYAPGTTRTTTGTTGRPTTTQPGRGTTPPTKPPATKPPPPPNN